MTLIQLLESGEHQEKLHIVSGCLRRASDAGGPIDVSTSSIDELIEHAPISRPSQLPDLLLLRLAELAPSLFEPFGLPSIDRSLLFLRDARELYALVHALAKDDVVQVWDSNAARISVAITLKGWRRIDEVQERLPRAKQAFVAMWFDESLNPVYDNAIYPALREVGYSPYIVRKQEHAGKIDDLIVAEIRRSGLLVADFTGNRHGVYFEAGFALGLGLPVIWTCKEGEVNDLHFDTRQYNHIIWKDETDLREKLTNRVLAVAPLRKSQS